MAIAYLILVQLGLIYGAHLIAPDLGVLVTLACIAFSIVVGGLTVLVRGVSGRGW